MAAERVKTKSRTIRDLAAAASATFTASTSQGPQDSRTISKLCYPPASAIYENNHNNVLADVDEDDDDDNNKYYMQERGVVNYAEELFYFNKIQELVNRKFDLFTRGELVLDDEDDEDDEEGYNTEKKQTNKASSSKAVKDEDNKKKNQLKKNIEPPISNDITERLKEHIIQEQNGTNIMLVIQKQLFASDIAGSQNRLTMPYNQLLTLDFLTEQEQKYLDDRKEIDVPLLGPTLQLFNQPMKLVKWQINSTQSYILRTNWHTFVQENKNDLKQGAMIQVWSYRKEDQNKPCFAIAVVKRAD